MLREANHDHHSKSLEKHAKTRNKLAVLERSNVFQAGFRAGLESFSEEGLWEEGRKLNLWRISSQASFYVYHDSPTAMFLFICLTVHFTCSMGYQPCWNAIPSREIPKNMPTHQTRWNMFFISFMFIRLRDYHDYAVFSPEPSLYPHQCNQHQDF